MVYSVLMTRYDVLAVVQAAKNLASAFKPSSKDKQRALHVLMRKVSRAGSRSAILIERANRDFAAYRRVHLKLAIEADRLDRKNGKLRYALLKTRSGKAKSPRVY